MAKLGLKQILGGPTRAGALVDVLAAALGGGPVAVLDASGLVVHGLANGKSRYPVTADGRDLGWVTGPPQASTVATLLCFLAERESERKSLGTEVLNLYREVNLIYSFSEKLAALLDLERVAQLTLQEARHLIVATDGALLLLDEASGALTTVAAFGDELPSLAHFVLGHGILGTIAATGVGEIVNDVLADPRRINPVADVRSLVSAPLTVGERVTGVIVLASTMPMAYEARELKLLTTLALQAATAIENARLFERTVQSALERERLLALNQEAEVARAGYERELNLAARIQEDLFPAHLPRLAGYDLAARSRPAKRCGGDYYDVIAADNRAGEVLLCVADVSGKGLPASLLMSNMQATLRALIGRSASLIELVAEANVLLYASTADNRYVTAAFLDLDPATGAGRYVSAGHVNSLLTTRAGDTVCLASTGAPLGMLPPGLPYTETAVTLTPGDTMLLYSDGVIDAQNARGEEFGEDRLATIVAECRHLGATELVAHVFDQIDAFAAEAPQFDDITILAIKRLAG
jgi:serine phosphatase RsbU (regulator of sigma subunit)